MRSGATGSGYDAERRSVVVRGSSQPVLMDIPYRAVHNYRSGNEGIKYRIQLNLYAIVI